MKNYIASIAVVGTIAAFAVFNTAGNSDMGGSFLAANEDQQVMLQFNQFISNQGKNYLTKEEYNARLTIFKQNYEIVTQHNAENEDFKLELNGFADLSDEEFEKRQGFKKINEFDDEEDLDEGEE